MVSQVIDTTLKERKCWVCKEGFETVKQRDNAQLMMIKGKHMAFVHLSCHELALDSVTRNPESLSYKPKEV